MFRDPNDRHQIAMLMEMLSAERERTARAEGQLDLAHEQLAIAQNNFEWARVRLNQIEAERAQLMTTLLRVPIQPVTIERPAEPASAPAAGAGIPMGIGFDFEDVGDEAAEALGISHDAAGGVRYRN